MIAPLDYTGKYARLDGVLSLQKRNIDKKFGIKLKLITCRILFFWQNILVTIYFFCYLAAKKKRANLTLKNHSIFETGRCSNSR